MHGETVELVGCVSC